VLDERSGIHGLKYNAVEKLGAPRYDEELDQYLGKGRNYGDIPRRILYIYNGYDVVCTWELDEYFDNEIDREDSRRLEPVRRRADGEYWGLRRLHDFLCDAASNFIYTGTVVVTNAPITESYSNDLRMIKITLTWNSGGGVHKRQATTFVSQYGLQRYVY